MLKPIAKNFKGLITISGPTKSGKSKLAEFFIKDQVSITYIATSRPRDNDPEWQRRINIHKKRRPDSWKLIEPPQDVCNAIKSSRNHDTFLLDSLGGLVEQHLDDNQNDWESFQLKFLNCLKGNDLGIIIVIEEIGWGIVPGTPIGHLFRERHTDLSTLICKHSNKQWLAINGIAIDLEKIGYLIP